MSVTFREDLVEVQAITPRKTKEEQEAEELAHRLEDEALGIQEEAEVFDDDLAVEAEEEDEEDVLNIQQDDEDEDEEWEGAYMGEPHRTPSRGPASMSPERGQGDEEEDLLARRMEDEALGIAEEEPDDLVAEEDEELPGSPLEDENALLEAYLDLPGSPLIETLSGLRGAIITTIAEEASPQSSPQTSPPHHPASVDLTTEIRRHVSNSLLRRAMIQRAKREDAHETARIEAIEERLLAAAEAAEATRRAEAAALEQGSVEQLAAEREAAALRIQNVARRKAARARVAQRRDLVSMRQASRDLRIGMMEAVQGNLASVEVCLPSEEAVEATGLLLEATEAVTEAEGYHDQLWGFFTQRQAQQAVTAACELNADTTPEAYFTALLELPKPKGMEELLAHREAINGPEAPEQPTPEVCFDACEAARRVMSETDSLMELYASLIEKGLETMAAAEKKLAAEAEQEKQEWEAADAKKRAERPEVKVASSMEELEAEISKPIEEDPEKAARRRKWEEANAKALEEEAVREAAVQQAHVEVQEKLRWEPMPLAKEVSKDKTEMMLGLSQLRGPTPDPASVWDRAGLDRTLSVEETLEGWAREESLSPSPEPPPGNRTSFLKGMASAGKSRASRDGSPGRARRLGRGKPNAGAAKKGRPATAAEARHPDRARQADSLELERPDPGTSGAMGRPATAQAHSGEADGEISPPFGASRPRWVGVATPHPRLIEKGSAAYTMKPDLYEQTPKFVDPNYYQPDPHGRESGLTESIQKLQKQDRISTLKKGTQSQQRLLSKQRRARPASAFQTMTQMSGMYVRRAPGGVPEPVDVDLLTRDLDGDHLGVTGPGRPATALGARERDRIANDLTIQGEDKARAGRWNRAIPEYSAAIEVNDKYAPAFWRRGCAQWELGNYGAAIEDYNRLYMLDPKMTHSDSARKHKLNNERHKARSRPAWGAGKAVKRDPLTGLPEIPEGRARGPRAAPSA